ncbi:hypothetical protein K2173_023608 [Erythroxylum novogranatense]|uniref:Uncharacterized protein n=1 Tax=Erythroxylum novogranatense TaxID=1862640 RepID=A0AAV8TS23_9ROSI|nr:hypothetical protein K2173_023608 [Erythroxylum novogranatense]
MSPTHRVASSHNNKRRNMHNNKKERTHHHENPTAYKLRKIPPILTHQTQRHAVDDNHSEPDDNVRMVEAEEQSGMCRLGGARVNLQDPEGSWVAHRSIAKGYKGIFRRRYWCVVRDFGAGVVSLVSGVANPLKREAVVVIEGLYKMGVKPVMMTGDNWRTAQAVAKERLIRGLSSSRERGEGNISKHVHLLQWKDRWFEGVVHQGREGLIAGRITGHKAEEIERFWLMRHDKVFANRRKQLKKSRS